MGEPKGAMLPVYFVADESYSMCDDVADLNTGLATLHMKLQGESMAASKVRFCVMGFADTAVCYLEPADMLQLETMPQLTARGSTSFAAAFAALHQRIQADVDVLKAEGYKVFRPAVFFLTDGEPNPGDPWRAELAKLLSLRARPNILAFGIGDADADVIRQVATNQEYAFATAVGTDTGEAISKFITALTQSVINSGQALDSGQGDLQIEKPANFVSLKLETM